MPTTSRNAIRYPGMSDPPDIPGDLKKLADDVDALLNRAIVCTSATRPGSPGQGLLIYESDTALVRIYRNGAWRTIASSDELVTGARWTPSASQSIPANAEQVLAFPTDPATPCPLLTKSTYAEGHFWTLNRAGKWAISATQRFNTSSTSSDVFVWVVGNNGGMNSVILDQDGNTNVQRPCTRRVSYTRRFAEGVQLWVRAFSSVAIQTAGVNGGSSFTAEWLGP